MLQNFSSQCLAPLCELAGLSKAVSVLLDKRLGHSSVPRSERLGACCPYHVPSAFWQGLMGHIATSAASHKCSIFCQFKVINNNPIKK